MLTFVFAPIYAPFSNSSETVAVWPLKAALCKEVPPSYNSNAERQYTDVAHTYIAHNSLIVDDEIRQADISLFADNCQLLSKVTHIFLNSDIRSLFQ